jgi:hypothetical protein
LLCGLVQLCNDGTYRFVEILINPFDVAWRPSTRNSLNFALRYFRKCFPDLLIHMLLIKVLPKSFKDYSFHKISSSVKNSLLLSDNVIEIIAIWIKSEKNCWVYKIFNSISLEFSLWFFFHPNILVIYPS